MFGRHYREAAERERKRVKEREGEACAGDTEAGGEEARERGREREAGE